MNGTLREDARLRRLEQGLRSADAAFDRAYRSLAGEEHVPVAGRCARSLGPRWRDLLAAQARQRSAEELLLDRIEELLDAWELR